MIARARPAARSAVLVVGCLVLAACATVPSSGPIEQGPVVDAGESSQFIRVIAAPPSVGASASEIVRGFLEANASLESDHDIARRYLTPQASASWDPDAATTVYQQSSLELSGNSSQRITASMDIHGRLLADGTLEAVDPPRTEEHDFVLEQMFDGASGVPQWRIADPPPGVLISDVDLRRAYREYQVYHPSARSEVLIPEGRLLPVVGPSLPTALAQRVLAGPAEWLAPGARAGAPPGTGLALGAVPVEDGVAVVDLTDQALAATDAQRRDLAAQLTWTLTQVPGVTWVRLRTGGEPYDVPGAPELMDRAVWQRRSPEALTTGPQGVDRVPYFVLEGSSMVRVSESGSRAVVVEAPFVESLVDLGVSLDQRTAAAVSPDRRSLWILPLDKRAEQSQVQGRGLSGASFDVDGRPWFIDGGRVMHLGPGELAEEVPILSGKPPEPVSSVHLARDGARAVLVAGGLLHLAVIHEEADSVVISTTRRIGTSVSKVGDVAWRDSGTLDVIGVADDRGRQVLRVSVGSDQEQALGSPAQAQEVTAAPGSPTLVATQGGQLLANVGLQWRAQGSARSVAYPG